jgi:hypothetical protein
VVEAVVADFGVVAVDFEAAGELLEEVEVALLQRSCMGRIHRPLRGGYAMEEKLEEVEATLSVHPSKRGSAVVGAAVEVQCVVTMAAEAVCHGEILGIEPKRARLLQCCHRCLVL